jgi:hypothetical protein
MNFPESDYASSSLTGRGDNLVFNHSAFDVDILRYSWNFGKD